VIFTGLVKDEDLPSYYALCDVYATCTLWEGYDMPLAEAQACGKRVVAFDIGPHKEILNKGVLVGARDIEEFKNKMLYLLSK
jgi:1,2-diacylglycerol 3-alpha-glucosyltransferase